MAILSFFKSKAPAPKVVAPPRERADVLLQRLEWTVLKRLDGMLQGDHRTVMRGNGLDLADLREYQLHDDVRHMDWNVTARLQQPHVRIFTEDRDMTAWFLLDLSPSVDFGSGAQRKSDVLLGFVGVLARLIGRHGNRVGAMLWGAGSNAVLPARGGRAQVLQMLQRIGSAERIDKAKEKGGEGGVTRLADLLRAAAHTVRQRSTVFVVSDFISEPGWEKPLGELALRHDVVAVRLLDPLELALPDLGLLTVRDAETGEQMRVDTGDAGFRQRYARIATAREAQLRESLNRAGVPTLELVTNGDLFDAVLRFVDLRASRHSARAGGSRQWPAHLARVAEALM